MPNNDSSNEQPSHWSWTPEEIKRIGYQVIDLIADHLSALPEGPVFRPVPEQISGRFLDPTPPPERGQSPDEILQTFKTDIEPFPLGNGHPRFFAWVNSPPSVMGIFADALAATMNPSCAGGNHAAVYVERQVVNWFKEIVGFPASSMGLLVSGGSMAALTALAVARHAKAGFDVRGKGLQGSSGDEPARGSLVVYKTAEGHGCNQKAIELLGIGNENLRTIERDADLRMIPSALAAAIDKDLAQGNIPIAVVASAGTVNTGAIDPIDQIADICSQRNVWLHVDGAYGAPAIISARYKSQLSGLARCDSLAIDPHKWLFVPVEAGLVLVRSAEQMRGAFSLVPPYLQTDGDPAGVGGPPWFSEYGIQQTRGFRALKIWMALKHFGVSGYRDIIDGNIALAERLAAAVREAPDLELRGPQSLSIVCFRYAPPGIATDGAAADGLNELNKRLLQAIQLSGRAFLSGTVIDNKFWLRACIVNYRTSAADIDDLLELVRTTGKEMVG